MSTRTLGINGLGRIGKLSLWYHLTHDDIDTIVVNLGREVGSSINALIEYICKDSTYGGLHRYLGGVHAQRDVTIEDAEKWAIKLHGKSVRFLTTERNPAKLNWREHGVEVVVDCTGAFVDPTEAADAGRGSLRGHLEAGARVVVQSSAFKVKSGERTIPDDAVTLIYGINHNLYDPLAHKLVSAASCTTTGLAHMLQPLLSRDLTRRILTAGMSTIHAATNSQSVLDNVPKAGATDLRKTRMSLNNIILTSTNAARALEQVIPEIKKIGFMADSVRIPTATVSMIILNCTFQTELDAGGLPQLNRQVINGIYRDVAGAEAAGLVRYTDEQNVSADIIADDAAIVIEGADTHTRTGFINVEVPTDDGKLIDARIPVTHVKIFGWYDNELGSYTNRLGQLTRHLL